jgi:hypothetical protein
MLLDGIAAVIDDNVEMSPAGRDNVAEQVLDYCVENIDALEAVIVQEKETS